VDKGSGQREQGERERWKGYCVSVSLCAREREYANV
jgi:hypothetical protein